ncbi:Shedu anti-phage system protein SduA domain-containing protein [Chryseobacterium scophthalmum]|nr:Shedu anti-phage system protein SduA domain-containing protein [Chryseobacterium scophthalmum]
MQIEKYIYYLNRWGEDGEKYLTKKYKDKIPEGFNINITNPKGIIIMGRIKGLTLEQKKDFEVVKRKYKNVLDIISYDDLLNRLKLTIEQIKNC